MSLSWQGNSNNKEGGGQDDEPDGERDGHDAADSGGGRQRVRLVPAVSGRDEGAADGQSPLLRPRVGAGRDRDLFLRESVIGMNTNTRMTDEEVDWTVAGMRMKIGRA